MPSKSDVVAEQLAAIRQDLRGLWTALRTDPKAQKRKERGWALLTGALGAATTVVARQLATKLYTRLTGEPPPLAQKAREEAAEVREEVGS
jgi:hypothetical protein